MFPNPLKALCLVLALAIAAFRGPVADAAETDPAARQVQTFYAGLLDVMKRGPQLGIRGRYEALTPIVGAAFDIPTMIKFIVGSGWSSTPESDQQALVQAFRRMTIANYANNFASYSGERFEVEPIVQTRGQDRFVTTTLVPSNGKSVPLIYRMRGTNGTWKIIDVLMNGYVSELATRRSDFASTLSSGGAPALVKQLNALSDKLLSGTKTAGQ